MMKTFNKIIKATKCEMKTYAISGLGADKRVFDYINLNTETISIDWIKPLKNEEISHYSKRLIEKYKIEENSCILGVSFGGLIAIEISKIIETKLIILISSAETKSDLRRIYQIVGKVNILQFIPQILLKPPKRIMKWLFGAQNKELLYEILDDTDLDFAKWSLIKLTNWKNTKRFDNCIKISGDKDKLLPIKQKDDRTIIVKGGEHFMIVDKAREISEIINGIA